MARKKRTTKKAKYIRRKGRCYLVLKSGKKRRKASSYCSQGGSTKKRSTGKRRCLQRLKPRRKGLKGVCKKWAR